MSTADMTIRAAVKEAQRILADYVEPGPRDADKTINKLLDVLDDPHLVEVTEDADAVEPELSTSVS